MMTGLKVLETWVSAEPVSFWFLCSADSRLFLLLSFLCTCGMIVLLYL